jgi:hypothetical protein
MSEAMPLFPPYAFMAWTGKTLPFAHKNINTEAEKVLSNRDEADPHSGAALIEGNQGSVHSSQTVTCMTPLILVVFPL